MARTSDEERKRLETATALLKLHPIPGCNCKPEIEIRPMPGAPEGVFDAFIMHDNWCALMKPSSKA